MSEYWPTSTTDYCTSTMDILCVTAITMISVCYESVKNIQKMLKILKNNKKKNLQSKFLKNVEGKMF